MSEGKEHPSDLSAEAVELQQNGDLPQCVSKLRALQRHLMETDRWQLSGSVLWSLCGVIQAEQDKWRPEEGEQVERPSLRSLEVVSCALCCLRNAMPNCARNQELVAETEDLLNPIISCIRWTFNTPEATHPSAENTPVSTHPLAENTPVPTHLLAENTPKTTHPLADTPEATHPPAENTPEGSTRGGVDEGSVESDEEWQKCYSSLALSCVTCLGNIVAANSKTRKIVWPSFKSVMESVLVFRDKSVAQAATMTLHNCLLEDELRTDLCSSPAGPEALQHLLTLYETETKYSCFVLLCLEVLLASEGFLENTWLSLPENHQCLSLQVVEVALTTHSSKPLSHSQGNSTLTFLGGVFKTQADCILRSHNDSLKPESAQVLCQLVTLVCGVAASDTWRHTLQQDTSLLVTCVALLQCLHEVGQMGGNAFTPLDRFTDLENETQMTRAEQHPSFGFKCDLIRLIASLVYLNTQNQNTVREMGGLTLILESSKFDARNPLIKEACVFALRNLLEGNLENQRTIGELRLEGVAHSPSLAEMGMEAVQDGDKIRIVQRSPPSSCDSPQPEL